MWVSVQCPVCQLHNGNYLTMRKVPDGTYTVQRLSDLDSSWNVMAHGDAREGKWRGNWWMEWVASTLHTTSEHGVSSITTADATPRLRLPLVEWTDVSADLNGLVRFAERRNLVSASVPSHLNWSIPTATERTTGQSRPPVTRWPSWHNAEYFHTLITYNEWGFPRSSSAVRQILVYSKEWAWHNSPHLVGR